MYYVSPNYLTKESLIKGVEEKRRVVIYSPTIATETSNGVFMVHGPRRLFSGPGWSAKVTTKNGFIVKVE